jgi:hypothetical protein
MVGKSQTLVRIAPGTGYNREGNRRAPRERSHPKSLNSRFANFCIAVPPARVEQQSVATPQAARGWTHPPCRHIKIQSCCVVVNFSEPPPPCGEAVCVCVVSHLQVHPVHRPRVALELAHPLAAALAEEAQHAAGARRRHQRRRRRHAVDEVARGRCPRTPCNSIGVSIGSLQCKKGLPTCDACQLRLGHHVPQPQRLVARSRHLGWVRVQCPPRRRNLTQVKSQAKLTPSG